MSFRQQPHFEKPKENLFSLSTCLKFFIKAISLPINFRARTWAWDTEGRTNLGHFIDPALPSDCGLVGMVFSIYDPKISMKSQPLHELCDITDVNGFDKKGMRVILK